MIYIFFLFVEINIIIIFSIKDNFLGKEYFAKNIASSNTFKKKDFLYFKNFIKNGLINWLFFIFIFDDKPRKKT